MEQKVKPRVKSPLVMAEAHFQNLKEEQHLCEKLDGMHCQHYATMSTLREETSQAEKQFRNLCAQRTLTQCSTLDVVMTEIRSLKDARLSKVKQAADLRLEPEILPRVGSASPKPRHARAAQEYSSSWDVSRDGVDGDSASRPWKPFLRRAASAGERSQFTLAPATVKNQDASKMFLLRKPRAKSSLLRKSDSAMDMLSYRKLERIAKIENISLKEAERKRQAKMMARERINQLLDDSLQHKISNFLNRFKDKQLDSIPKLP